MKITNKVSKKQLDLLTECLKDMSHDEITQFNDIDWLYNSEVKELFFPSKPECYLKVADREDLPIFPVCNRRGLYDPSMIKLSMMICNKHKDANKIDSDQADQIQGKLKMMHMKYLLMRAVPDQKSVLNTYLNNI